MSAFEIGVGTTARLIACDNCPLCDDDEVGCVHGRLNGKLVEVIKQYATPSETLLFAVRVVSTGEETDNIRLWDLERMSPLEQLAEVVIDE